VKQAFAFRLKWVFELTVIRRGRRIYAELRAQGISCSKNRVVRLKRKAGIMAKTRRRFKVTTDSKHELQDR
jgi:transposase InsO family protein